MTSKMSAIERSLKALNFHKADRVPILGGWILHPQFFEKVTGANNFWDNPRKIAIEGYRKLGTDAIVTLSLPYSPQEFRAFDIHGFLKNMRKYKSPEDVVEYVKNLPSPEALEKNFKFEEAYQSYIQYVKENQQDIGDMLWISAGWEGVAGFCRFMWYETFGYDNFFTALLLDKGWMKKLFEYSGEEGRLRNIAVAKAIEDEKFTPVILLGEDICDNRGPMVSPRLLDEIYFPNLRRSLQPLKDAGIKIVWHSDGNINPILDRLINYIEVDGFQGFQEELGVSFAEIAKKKTKSGKKLILFGSMSVSRTLPWGSVEDVKREVEYCIDSAARGGGFFLFQANTVGPEVPVENLLAMYEHARQYGEGKF